MHVGIDARLFSYQPAGIGYYTHRLLAALATVDAEDRFTVFLSRRDRAPTLAAPNFGVRRLWTPCHHRYEQLGLAAELAPCGLDLLHSPDFVPPFYRRYRSVITVHDLAFLHFPELLTAASRRYYGQIDRAVRSADAIIAVSESTRRDLLAWLDAPLEKVTVVYEAADVFFRPLEAEELSGEPAWTARLPSRFLLFVGTLEPRKNLSVLLQAFARLPGGRRPEKLLLVGRPGWLHEELYRLVDELHLADRVVFFGPATLEELRELYNRATLLVMPSRYEGFGLPVLEAMACGLPVVASRAGSLPEVVGEAGDLFDPEDVEGLAGLLARTLDDAPLRQQMRERGLLQAARFSWTRAARETLAVYRRVVRLAQGRG